MGAWSERLAAAPASTTRWTGRARPSDSQQPLLVHYDLDDGTAGECGVICGGQMDVFIEPLHPASHLYVIGAGHVGREVARAAFLAGFQVHVVDDRAEYANAERFPDAVEVVVDDIPGWLARTELPPRAYAVIVTRGHRHDHDALNTLAGRDLAYVGMIGSRPKVRQVFDSLAARGVPAEALARVHAPVGLRPRRRDARRDRDQHRGGARSGPERTSRRAARGGRDHAGARVMYNVH